MIASSAILALLGVAFGESIFEFRQWTFAEGLYLKMEHSTDQCAQGYVPVKSREDCIAAGEYLMLDNVEYPSIEEYNFETPFPHCIYLDQRMQYYPNGQGGWKNTNGNYICKRMDYYLAPLGAKSCDYGTAVSQDMCQGAVATLAEYLDETPARTLQVLPYDMPACTTSGWSKVPVGCSAQTGGDWAAHFKPEGHAVCDTDVVSPYQVICTNQECKDITNQDYCTGACRWIKDSCREPCSAIDKRSKCRAGCEWDSQEKVCKDECSYTTPASRGLNVLVCEDGSECNGATDGWDCCTAKGGRAQCPQNYPYMCEDKACGGGTAHCCSTFANCENSGGLRTCQDSEGERRRPDVGECAAIETRRKCRGDCVWNPKEKECQSKVMEIPATQCPQTEPTHRGTCTGDLRCEYGEECCCGECFASKLYRCKAGTWAMMYMDACFRSDCGELEGERRRLDGRRRFSKECGCPWTFEPVCGENNKTYLNECEAECHGHAVAKKGWCGGWTGHGRRRVSHMLRRRTETHTQTSVRRRADNPSTTVRRLQGETS